jgi:hypothetical protein
MRSKLAAALIAAPFLWASSAVQASQISIAGSTSGAVSFTSVGDNTHLNVTFTTAPFAGSATYDSAAAGSYTLGAFTPVTVSATLQPSGDFTFNATQLFHFADGTNTLNGTVTWNQLNDNTPTPSLHNTAVGANLDSYTTCTGSAAFVADFCAAGKAGPMDITFTNVGIGGLDALVKESAGNSVTANLSSGEVAPAPVVGHGLLVLLAVGGVLFSGKLFESLKKRHLQAA